jgi:HAD superfamily hydrolase (TIGR01509 family)
MLRRKKNAHYLQSLKDDVSPATTVIAFDLHNVVFKKQTRKIIVSCLKLFPQGTWRYTLNPRLWYRAYRIKATSDVAEDIFQKVADLYPGLSRFRDDFIQLTNAQRPIRSVVALIKELKRKGYKLYILSNIGRDTFIELAELHPDISSCFDGAFTSCAENNYSQKPHADFYEQFKAYLKQQGHEDKQILFIDDLKKNIAAAAQCNIAGVHYISSKRLKNTFELLDIL